MLDIVSLAPSPSPPSATASRRAGVHPRRWLKLGAALALIGAAVYALVSAFGSVVSDNAVVTAYTVALRTPIAGDLSGLHTAVGASVAAGTVLARLQDPRVDDEHLVDLRNLLDRTRGERASYQHERDELGRQRAALLARAAQRDRSEALYLQLQAVEAAGQLRQRESARDYAHRDLARMAELGHSGDAPAAMVDKARATAEQADRDAEAALARLAYLRVEAEAAAHGVLLESGSNDVPYSSQRADEIAVQLAGLDRQIAQLAGAEQETSARLAAEQRRIDLLRQATLVAPSAGMVWKLGAADGEHLAAGDEVIELVDCRAAFVIAAIAQDRFSDVAIGGTAQVRLSGESFDRPGRVVSVTGDAGLSNDRNLAAVPVSQRTASAMAQIELAPSAQGGAACLVGRTARVLLPTAPGSNFFSMLLRRFF